MPRMVLLLHELPDRSQHFDWLLEPDAPSRGLITFRVESRIDADTQATFIAQRIADHRPEYLTYQGPIAAPQAHVTSDLVQHNQWNSIDHPFLPIGDPQLPMGLRGRVRRVAVGTCRVVRDESGCIELHGQFEEAPPARWVGVPTAAVAPPLSDPAFRTSSKLPAAQLIDRESAFWSFRRLNATFDL